MPRGQPFTRLCQQIAQLRSESQRADLHLHTTHSDGAFTPAEVVRRAAARGLGAIAITDHDTCSAFPEARSAALQCDNAPEIIPGAEITCDYRGRSLHLLAYSFDPDNAALDAALAELRQRRRARFAAMVARLPAAGLPIPEPELAACMNGSHTVGRPDLAALLVKHGHATSMNEAFARFLHDGGPLYVPLHGHSVGEAIALVCSAGGVTSWAHPPEEIDLRQVEELRDLGLTALEAVHPSFNAARERNIRAMARVAGLAITGGSDNHGPTPPARAIGAWGVRRMDLAELKKRASLSAPAPM